MFFRDVVKCSQGWSFKCYRDGREGGAGCPRPGRGVSISFWEKSCFNLLNPIKMGHCSWNPLPPQSNTRSATTIIIHVECWRSQLIYNILSSISRMLCPLTMWRGFSPGWSLTSRALYASSMGEGRLGKVLEKEENFQERGQDRTGRPDHQAGDGVCPQCDEKPDSGGD